MIAPLRHAVLPIAAAILLTAFSQDAFAFRCGNRLVLEGMLESEVIERCGEPTDVRQLGFVIRPYLLKVPAGLGSAGAVRQVYSGFHQEVAVTEAIYDFGPRKLIRVLRFEGGRLASVSTAGYGHRDS